MATSDTWVLLASGAIGAGGAVLAQLIASVTTRLGDSKRQEHEDEQQRNTRFLEIKRELYSAFLLEAEKLVDSIDIHCTEPFDIGVTDELLRIHSSIWLIASPEVTRTVRVAIADLATAKKQCSFPEMTEERRSKVKGAARTAIGSARDALSADLTGYNWPARNRTIARRK